MSGTMETTKAGEQSLTRDRDRPAPVLPGRTPGLDLVDRDGRGAAWVLSWSWLVAVGIAPPAPGARAMRCDVRARLVRQQK